MTLTAAELALQFDPDTRALWHLELLGCYAPDDAIAPYLPPPARTPHDNDNDCDDWGDLACTHCGGEGFCEVDDPLWDECDEYGWGRAVRVMAPAVANTSGCSDAHRRQNSGAHGCGTTGAFGGLGGSI